ncbi:mitochondrial distribution and morphology protein 10 [Hysterangium stoloniferum]|nr:mitochondrial distribution and morphology protein 10 [Hysterangium stoloniferum]
MFTFTSYVLRNYYQATGWNEDNLYSNLTRSSTAILDFRVPRGLNFCISKSPNGLFSTTYSMNALPSLNGSIGYIFTSCNLNILRSGSVRFKDVVDRFKVYDQPRIPETREEIWLGGKRVDTKDYLLYGRMYIPSGRLDALYSVRLSPTFQAVVAAISDPRSNNPALSSRSTRGNPTAPGPSNLMLSLQQDTGRWCSEYTWSADDAMFGFRVLRNFGRLHLDSEESTDERPSWRIDGRKRVDEEEAMEGGLKGRLSAGAEIYFSAKEKSAGVSTGIRFTTLPDATPPSAAIGRHEPRPSQPPSTITAIFNPMMGHISTAYAARVSRDLSVCSRFDFNIYSYESEWAMGAEWWVRRSLGGAAIQPFVGKSDASGGQNAKDDGIQGVVKARISTNTDISLMWEGRLRNLLVSLGVVSDLAGGSKPIRAIGLELSYFSSE